MNQSKDTTLTEKIDDFLLTVKIHNKDLNICFNDAVAVEYLKQFILSLLEEEIEYGNLTNWEKGYTAGREYQKKRDSEEVRKARVDELDNLNKSFDPSPDAYTIFRVDIMDKIDRRINQLKENK